MTTRDLSIRLVWLVLTLGLVPPISWYLVFGRAPSLDPGAARAMLQSPGSSAVLVDVRDAGEYARAHVPAAFSWPLMEIRKLSSADGLPAPLKGRTLLLFCRSGILSGRAVLMLRRLGVDAAFNVKGGLDLWMKDTAADCPPELCTFTGTDGNHSFPDRPLSMTEQNLAVFSAFVVKPAYMLLSLAIIIRLWSQEGQLRFLRDSLIAFLAGEIFCAANYLFCGESSTQVEYLHMLGMALAFGLAAQAAWCYIGEWRAGSNRASECRLADLCTDCRPRGPACGLFRMYAFIVPAAAALAVMPLLSSYETRAFHTVIWGSSYYYVHYGTYQLFERWSAPLIALGCLLGALLLAGRRGGGRQWSETAFFAGLGFLGFSLFRIFLFAVFAETIQRAVFWEEATEFITVAGLAYGLYVFDAWRRKGTKPETARAKRARRGS